MSQCPHCRGLRKSRATHAACECGTKPHKAEDHDDTLETKSDPGQQQRCCCSHGQRCTCALKTEPLDTVPEMNPPALPGTIRRNSSNKKPRLAKAGSDTSISTFSNRPLSSHGEVARPSGAPFKIPIPHSVPNKTPARRSTDSLPTLKRKTPHGHNVDAAGPRPKMRMSKSEQGSPGPRNMGQMPPLHFDFALDQIPQFDFSTPFYTPQDEPASLSGYSMSPPTEWPAFDAPLDEYSPYNHPNNPYSGFDHQPLAATSSGEVSDISDYLSQAGSRPQLSAANSDDSNIRRLSPAVYPSMSGSSSSLPSDENLGNRVQFGLQKAARKRPSNLSNESLTSQISQQSYHGLPQGSLPHNISPINQHFEAMPRGEAMEEAFLPPTSSPKVNTGRFSPTSAVAHKIPMSNANILARPPTSSPKQLNFPEQLSPPNYNAPLSMQEERAFHPTEVHPAEFSHGSQTSQTQRFAQQNQAAHVAHSMAMPQATPSEYSPTSQPSHTHGKPVELTPAEFGQANPVIQNPPPQRPRDVMRRQSSHGQSMTLKSPAIGGTDDFTKQGFSVQDAQRLAHPHSSELTQGMMSPGGYERQGISVYDLQQLAHPETSSESSSGPSSAGHEGRPDPFKHLSGLSAQDTQRLAFPTHPTEALSGLTIPQTTFRHNANDSSRDASAEAKIFWAGGGYGHADFSKSAAAASFVSQQEVERAAAGWGPT